jgi:hypothetical protein
MTVLWPIAAVPQACLFLMSLSVQIYNNYRETIPYPILEYLRAWLAHSHGANVRTDLLRLLLSLPGPTSSLKWMERSSPTELRWVIGDPTSLPS